MTALDDTFSWGRSFVGSVFAWYYGYPIIYSWIRYLNL